MPNTTYGTPYAQSSDLVSNWPGVSSNVADRIDDVSFKGNGLNDQTGTSYTLVLTDAGKTVTLNNASAITVTVPTNASVAYETGTQIQFTNKGAGVVTISPAGGVTLNNSVALVQNASATIQKLDTNTWVMISSPAPGLTHIVSSSFTAASSVIVNNCFSSTFENYLLLFNTIAITNSAECNLLLRASGTNAATNYNRQFLLGDSATASAGRSTAQTSGFALVLANTLYYSGVSMQLFRPNQIDHTMHISTIARTDGGPMVQFWAGLHTTAAAYDGFEVKTVSNTITGTVRVYGYRNS